MSHNSTRLSLALAAIVVFAALSVGLVAAPTSAQEDLPAAYYGTVEINGDDAPTDVVVKAQVDGEVVDEIEVDPEGQYSGPGPGDDALIVQPDVGEDEEVTFLLDGPGFSDEEADTEPETVEWEEGDVKQVDLELEVDIIEEIDLTIDGEPDEVTLEEGDTAPVEVIGTFQDDSTEDITDDVEIEFDPDDDTVQYDEIDQEIEALNAGETDVTADFEGVTDTVE